MNKIFCGILLFLTSLPLYAQISTSNGFEFEPNGMSFSKFIKTDKGNLYLPGFIVSKKRKSYEVKVLDAEMNLIGTFNKEIELESKVTQELYYLSFGGELYVLKYYNSKTKYSCYLQKIDENSFEEIGEAVKLIDVNKKTCKCNYSSPEYFVSPNEEYFGFKPKGGNFVVFGKDLGKVAEFEGSNKQDGFKFQKALLTDYGEVYRFYWDNEQMVMSKEFDGRVIIVKSDLDKGNSITKIIQHETFLVDPSFHLESDGILTLVGSIGVPSKRKNSNIIDFLRSGYYFFQFNEDLEQLTSKFTWYPNNLFLDGATKLDEKKAERAIDRGKTLGYANLRMRDFIIRDDGYYFVGEEYSSSPYGPISGSILILKMDLEGELMNYNKVFKRQILYFDYAGYIAYCENDNIYILFNDLKENANVTTMSNVVNETSYNLMNYDKVWEELETYVVEINEDLMVKYKLVGEVWQNKGLFPAHCRFEQGELYIFGFKGLTEAISTLKTK